MEFRLDTHIGDDYTPARVFVCYVPADRGDAETPPEGAGVEIYQINVDGRAIELRDVSEDDMRRITEEARAHVPGRNGDDNDNG